jgi:HNH endonuclease
LPAGTVLVVPRAKSDIANMAIRIFLQEMGRAYDEERQLPPYNSKQHFPTVRQFFEERCCYCGMDFASTAAHQDHLIPVNKTDLGLHAWGNIVPACQECNAKKHGSDWRDFIVLRAGADARERHAKVHAFIEEYRYAPEFDLRDTAEELYAEVGSIAITLINEKIKRIRRTI